MQLSESKFPVLSLSQRAAEVLKGNESVYHRRIAVSETREPADGLFEALRTLRKRLADKERIPPFAVFPDSTLKELCVKLPANESELMNVKGIGEVKRKKYGLLFFAGDCGVQGGVFRRWGQWPGAVSADDRGRSKWSGIRSAGASGAGIGGF